MSQRDGRGLGGLLAAAAESRGNELAIIDGVRTVSFAAYQAWVTAVAQQMRSLGVQRSDRVAMLLPNCAEFCVAVMATAELGAIGVLLNPRYTDDELEYLFEDSDPRLAVVAGGASSPPVRQGLAELCLRRASVEGVLVVEPAEHERDVDSRVAPFAPPPDLPPPDTGDRGGAGADPAIVIYTSGTTGRPKGAVLTHGNLLASVSGYAERLQVDAGDCLSVFTPMSHAGGLINGVCTALWAGCTAAIGDRLTSVAALGLLDTAAVSVYLAVPTMLVRQLDELRRQRHSFPALRAIVTGGAPVRPELAHEVQETFGVDALHVVYGLSEANMATLTAPGDLARSSATIVGKPTKEFEIRIASRDNGPAAPSTQGEILLRGGAVFSGYWRNPAATSECLDGDGWFHTGDVGYLTPDGDLAISGRLKDMYIQGGTNIYPAEIERVLELHPDVAIAAVVGRPHPVLGEVGCAFVVPHDGRSVPPEALLAYAEPLLAKFKLPHDIRVRAEVPLTAFGKVKKAELRAEAAEQARTESAVEGDSDANG